MRLKKSVWYRVSVVWLWLVLTSMIGFIVYVMYEAGILWIMLGVLAFFASIIAALSRVYDEG